jgi:hypothetical protein
MERVAVRMEEMLQEKLSCFRELVEILKEEKESIVNIDVAALWEFSRKKQRIVARIETIRREVLFLLEDLVADHGMTASTFSLLKVGELLQKNAGLDITGLAYELHAIKGEVRVLAGASKGFVEEYLAVVKDRIALIVEGANPGRPYGQGTGDASGLLMSQEV